VTYDRLTTVAALKQWLVRGGGAAASGTGPDDAEYAWLIQVCSELIGRFTGRDNLGSVNTYTENYRKHGMSRLRAPSEFNLVLRHYPIVSLVSVVANNSPVTIIDQNGMQAAQSGVMISDEENESRIINFQYVYLTWPITVTYTAGYGPASVPEPLQQACIQFAAEVYRSVDWLGVKSRAINTETVTYDTSSTWGMSNRIKMMLQPYVDVVPFRGY
jgi:hypothetical protein